MFVYVPSALFGSSTYVYLYSKFAGKLQTDTGAESWGVLPVSGGGGGTASISGNVFSDNNGDGVWQPSDPFPATPEPGVQNFQILLDALMAPIGSRSAHNPR